MIKYVKNSCIEEFLNDLCHMYYNAMCIFQPINNFILLFK